MSIKDISEYVYNGSAFVLKETNKSWFAKFAYALAFFIMLFVVFPNTQGSWDFPVSTGIVVSQIQNSDQKIIDYIMRVNPRVKESEAKKIVRSAFAYGNQFGVDPSTLLALAKVESTFDKYAISGVGAMGILQVMPRWHYEKFKEARKEIGNPEVFSIETGFYVGAQVFRDCKRKTGDMKRALLCYNGSSNDPNADYHIKVLAAKNEIVPLLKGIHHS